MWTPDAWPELLPLPAPGAGAALTYRIKGEAFEMPRIIRFTYTADGNAANRFPTVDYLSGDNAIFSRVCTSVALTAGLTKSYTFIVGLGILSNSAAGEEQWPLPEAMLASGLSVRIDAVNRQVGDLITAAFLETWRLPTGDGFESPGAVPYSS